MVGMVIIMAILILLLALESLLFILNWMEFVERRGKDDRLEKKTD